MKKQRQGQALERKRRRKLGKWGEEREARGILDLAISVVVTVTMLPLKC